MFLWGPGGMNPDAESALNTNWMKSVLVMNIFFSKIAQTLSTGDRDFEFKMCSVSENELQRVNMNLRRCQERVHNSGAFPSSAVIWVNFICNLLSYWFTDSATSPNLRGTTWREERQTFPPERVADLRKHLRWSHCIISEFNGSS
jgi:hypothetical protein